VPGGFGPGSPGEPVRNRFVLEPAVERATGRFFVLVTGVDGTVLVVINKWILFINAECPSPHCKSSTEAIGANIPDRPAVIGIREPIDVFGWTYL
jgi:hypothetical protein